MSKSFFLFSIRLFLFFFCFIADESNYLSYSKKISWLYPLQKKRPGHCTLLIRRTFSKIFFLNHWDKIDPKDQLEFEEAMKNILKINLSNRTPIL